MWKDRRRKFLLASGALLAAPFVSRAQARMPVVGFLLPQHKPSPEVLAGQIAKSPVLARLRELGWVEGKTFNAERAFGGPTIEGLSEAAANLVAKKVDVIWVQNSPGAVAAARATKSIPIVFVLASFVVESGLVDSFARPGRNVTGQAWFAEPLALLKPTELLREIVPKARRLAFLTVPPDLNMQTVAGGPVDLTSFMSGMNAGVRRLGFEGESFPIRNDSEFEQLLAAIEKWGPDCLRVASTTRTDRFQKQILEFARRHRLPDAYEGRNWIEIGGLASYGVVTLPMFRRSADMLDRILRGAKPADLPVEFPTHYEVAINLKTAKALGITVPQSVLVRADRVIE
jgi:putative ABC transport system substrate-binding protein